MGRLSKNKNIFLRLGILVSLSVVAGFAFSAKTDAAYSDLPTYLNSTYDQYISLESNDPITGRGNYTPSFRFLLYSPTVGRSDSVKISRGLANRIPRCDDFNITQAPATNDNLSDGQTRVGSDTNMNSYCSDVSDGFIINNLNRGSGAGWDVSERFGNNYSVTVIRIALKTSPDRPSVFADAEVRGGSDRLSYVGDNTSPGGSLDSSSRVSLSIPEPGTSTIRNRFAPPCNYNGARAWVWWKDADSRADANGGSPVNFQLREFRNGYSGSYTVVDSGDAGDGGTIYRSSFVPRSGAKYEMIFTGVQSRNTSTGRPANTIKIWMPFDSAAAHVRCDPPPASVGSCGTSVHFNIASGGSRVRVYALNGSQAPTNPRSGAPRGTLVYDEVHNATAEVDLDVHVGLDKLLSNNGWEVLVKPNSGGPNQELGPNSEYRFLDIGPCWNVSCSIQIDGNIPGDEQANRVMAGSTTEARVTIINNGSNRIPLNLNGVGQLGVNTDIGFVPINNQGNYPNGVNPGEAATSTPFTVPWPIGSYGFNGYPDMFGKFGLGPACPITYSTYQQFNITPIAQSPVMDDEDPRTITYITGGNNSGASVTLGWQRQLIRKRGGAVTTLDGIYSGASTFGNYTESHGIGSPGVPLVPGTLQAGDQVCSWANFSITDGWVGPGNDIAGPSAKSLPANPAESGCITISDRPYLRLYGSDAMAGSDFAVGGVCNNANSSEIKTYFSRHADRSGSGVHFAALAMGLITEFSSASLRTSTPIPTNGLSFANTGAGSPGSYAGANICGGDFYGETQYDDPAKKNTRSGSTLPLASLNTGPTDGMQTLAQPSGSPSRLTLNGTTGFNNRHTIYVDGDLNINSNIEYSAFTDPTDAPALAVIVSGNIYINRNVTRLDGLYVAQKRADNTGGTIFTCSDGFNEYDTDSPGADAALLANCSSQLTINGAFVADYVRFLRTINSLRDSRVNDQELTGITKAAEVFNFTPEIYLSPPPFNNETSSNGRYQSFETLPPIL
ncbi:hypothetical protein HZB74_01215 [Candidatus Saccharibacteria bacterium]|nr:hypothetical protein [Candidatus Saccharibacteria bacterium]